ncbi:type ISP restriction/modification enzyme [Magnetovibrio sp. PR-2]|uniref:type ISP restriction/modification enzyme n=1 Tax=Magnetovibrio sp. PR-2 TaxID=3120356 RepID=UPI002FCE3030
MTVKKGGEDALLDKQIKAVLDHGTDTFVELVEVGGLNPKTDFVGADLTDMDMRGADLRGFDFSHADLTGTDLRGAQFDAAKWVGVDLSQAITDKAEATDDASKEGSASSSLEMENASPQWEQTMSTPAQPLTGKSDDGIDALGLYLDALREVRASKAATKERSYIRALQELFSALGEVLSPSVRCIAELKNLGAGHPDLGFFTAPQLRDFDVDEALDGQLPERGVVEVKSLGHSVDELARSDQVTKYFDRYGLVVCTNMRQFVLVGRDALGRRVNLERFDLASSEEEFWDMAAKPSAVEAGLRIRFKEFVKRILLHNATLTRPQDVAWFLASYARDALARIESRDEPAQLTPVREALEGALGMRFEGDKGDHFFHSTFVQTLFYGLFSAWVVWSRKPASSRGDFTHQSAAGELKLPVLQALFYQACMPGALGALNLHEIMEWASMALLRIDAKAFYSGFRTDHAVQYFYEPFLEAFDPGLRKDLGVWYTPTEVVDYQVERVDQALREELGIEDGLADENVLILDPCTGTGSYLLGVLKRIEKTLRAKGNDALIGEDLKKAALERLYGFEIMPAPLVVAHVQIGMYLENLGVELGWKHTWYGGEFERPKVYFTNALTDWGEPDPQAPHLPYPELENERDDAREVKRDKRILVIIGNPPYNAYAGTTTTEEGDLVEVYKEGLAKKWGVKKYNLDELYVRFFRMAERKIAEMNGEGVVSFISNFSYLGGASFTVMRERLMTGFDRMWFDCLNGDSRETGKTTPDGTPDPSIFSTEFNKEGIRVGTAIGTLVRKQTREEKPSVHFRHFWGTDKRRELMESLDVDSELNTPEYEAVSPTKDNRFSFRPLNISPDYLNWPKVTDLCAEPPSNGLMEKRSGALIDIEPDRLKARMKLYYDQEVSWLDLEALETGLTKKAARFDPQKTREKVLAGESYNPDHLRPYIVRPFDTRWCYYSSIRPLWNEPRPKHWEQNWKGNSFFISRVGASVKNEGVPFFFSNALTDDHLLSPDAACFPLFLRNKIVSEKASVDAPDMLDAMGADSVAGSFIETENLSESARSFLKRIGWENSDDDIELAERIWHHALAIGYSPLYLLENEDGVKTDWPRIPFPDSFEALRLSAGLGTQVSILLDTGRKRPSLYYEKSIGPFILSGWGKLKADDLKVTAKWGRHQQGGVMPGRGDVRPSSWLDGVADKLEQDHGEGVYDLLGHDCVNIHLNDTAYWANVPTKVWEYRIGGYQVLKKWLSYRELDILGRPITTAEARYFTDVVQRLTRLCLMEPELDENYKQCRDNAYAWPKSEE